MSKEDTHLTDEQLLLSLEGELPARAEKRVRAHLGACWACRARRKELDDTIAGVVRAYQSEFEGKLPPIEGPRALLKARLRQLSSGEKSKGFVLRRLGLTAAGVCGIALLGVFLFRFGIARRSPSQLRELTVSSPDSQLTPGATVLANRWAVCSQANVKNKAVPAVLRQAVFQEYGLQGADLGAYEVDYLVTPALGGADDIHNLWPESYSAEWNAQVKDALEDRLRDLVCDGSLDLGKAQREIATDWIATYKKYFQTDKPLAEHLRRRAP
ncbi:MAG TPA: hypothetical protein VMI94_11345 [Bryobacteraceae bacterium]|nr:hypothetical protein [Bryobacteraceae bacterium]